MTSIAFTGFGITSLTLMMVMYALVASGMRWKSAARRPWLPLPTARLSVGSSPLSLIVDWAALRDALDDVAVDHFAGSLVAAF